MPELRDDRVQRGVLRSMRRLACCLAAITPLAARADTPPGITDLEILPSGHIALQVTVNGKGPFRMVLDTGSPVTLLNGRAAQRSGLISAADAKQPILMGMRGQFAVKELRIGGLRAGNVAVMVMDHPTVEILSQLEGPLDGILGFSFFSRYRTTIDYAGKRVSFAPVSYIPQDIMALVMGRLMGGEARRIAAPSGLWGMALDKPDDAPGVRVIQIYAQSAAQAAGIKVGDRLLTLDNRWTDTLLDCYEAASLAPAGQEITVKVLRDRIEHELSVHPRVGL